MGLTHQAVFDKKKNIFVDLRMAVKERVVGYKSI